MSNNQELVMETTHGRSKKCKTEFKAVLNKVLVSGLVLATMLGTATPAFAAELSIKDAVNGGYNNSNIVSEYGVSVESAIQNIRNTIQAIENMKANGSVSDSQIKELASQLYSLESAVLADEGVTSDVVSVLNSAENAIKGLSNASEAEVALAVVRSNLGIDSVTVSNKTSTDPSPLTSFSDVKSDHWAYNAIMDMSVGNHAGLFGGTSKAVNGIGTFSPSSPMTRAQFIAVVVRALYPNELAAKNNTWDMSAYEVALDKGLLKENEFDANNLNVSMTRQEMAMVLVRACESKGEYPAQLVSTSRISDYSKIGNHYQEYVVEAFSMGLLNGKDSSGRFDPMGTLNRDAGATVLYRLVEPSTRKLPELTVETPAVGVQTITEGQISERRPAKEGDIFIKSDGTRITLKNDVNGVLGGGQGVAPDIGMCAGGEAVKNGIIWHYMVDEVLTDSLGNKIQNDTYYVNRSTGEGYWGKTWTALTEIVPRPTEKGSSDGEVSTDPYKLYCWSDVVDMWLYNK